MEVSKADLEVMALGSLGVDFEAKAVSKARFGMDQRLGVSKSIVKLQRWAYWVFGSPVKARHGKTRQGMV